MRKEQFRFRAAETDETKRGIGVGCPDNLEIVNIAILGKQIGTLWVEYKRKVDIEKDIAPNIETVGEDRSC